MAGGVGPHAPHGRELPDSGQQVSNEDLKELSPLKPALKPLLFEGAASSRARAENGGPEPKVPTDARVKVLVVDPHPIMLAGLRCVLESDPEIALVGACATGGEALGACRQARPSLVIMDVALPDMNGADLIRTIKESAPHVNVLVLTASDDNPSVFGAIGAGASGYVLKDITPDNLLRAVRAMRRGQTMVNPGITRRLLDRLSVITRDGNGGLLYDQQLTEREAEILVEVTKGLSNKEIARKLFISESTVKSRLRTIFNKIDARDRAQAAAFALRGGYVR